jgi:hypothetical protein
MPLSGEAGPPPFREPEAAIPDAIKAGVASGKIETRP